MAGAMTSRLFLPLRRRLPHSQVPGKMEAAPGLGGFFVWSNDKRLTTGSTEGRRAVLLRYA